MYGSVETGFLSLHRIVAFLSPSINSKALYLSMSELCTAYRTIPFLKRVTEGFYLSSRALTLSSKLRLHDAIYRLQLYSNSLIHILSLSNLHDNVASIQKIRVISHTV